MMRDTKKLLKSRAREMAKEVVSQDTTSDFINVIVFSLGSETYAIESDYVKEVYPLKDFTPLPSVPSFILGLMNVRGGILPVLDLKKFFNLPEKGISELNKVIILQDEHMEFGILADTVQGTISIDTVSIGPIPPTLTGIGEEYLRGVTTDNIIIINGEVLLSDKRLIINTAVD